MELAKILYHANASKIYLLGRSESAGKAAINTITSIPPASDMPKRGKDGTGVVSFLHLDLSDLSTIKETAHTFLRTESRLDIIWHNAGIMLAPEGSMSKQGHELSFATNVLGPFLLQHFLTPILVKTAVDPDTPKSSVRTCWAASSNSPSPPGEDGILWNDWGLMPPAHTGLMARTTRYMQSKACNTILAAEMATRYGEVISVAFNWCFENRPCPPCTWVTKPFPLPYVLSGSLRCTDGTVRWLFRCGSRDKRLLCCPIR